MDDPHYMNVRSLGLLEDRPLASVDDLHDVMDTYLTCSSATNTYVNAPSTEMLPVDACQSEVDTTSNDDMDLALKLQIEKEERLFSEYQEITDIQTLIRCKPNPPEREAASIYPDQPTGGGSANVTAGATTGDTSDSSDDNDYVNAVFLQLPSGKTRYIFNHMHSELEEITSKMTDPVNFELTPLKESTQSGINIIGNSEDKPMALGKLTLLSSQLQTMEKPVTDKGFALFLLSDIGVNELHKLEAQLKITAETNLRDIPEAIVKQDPYENLSDWFQGASGIKITLHQGSITDKKFQSDVIVNSVSKYGDLSLGNVSKQLMEAGGKRIRQEFVRKSASNTKEFVETCGGQLACKKIYHVVCPTWNETEACEQKVRELIKHCLDRANRDRHKTISFPAIGTGRMKFPPGVVARVMLDTIFAFSNTPQGEAHLAAINIILYPLNRDVIVAFKSEFRARKEAYRQQHTNSAPHILTTPEGVRLAISGGSLVDEQVDAIVNTTSCSLDLSVGHLSNQLLKKGGHTIQAQCKERRPKGVQFGDIVATTGGNMPCQLIYHVACPEWKDTESKLYKEVASSCLMAAHRDQLSSVALPAIGTGYLKYPADFVARVILEEVLHFSEANPWTTLKDIRVVVSDVKILKDMKSFLKREQDSVWPAQQNIGATTCEEANDSPSVLLLNLVGVEGDILHQAFDTMHTFYRDNKTICTVNDPTSQQRISVLDQTQMNILRGIQMTYGAYVEINKQSGQESIRIEGFNMNVRNATQTVKDILQNSKQFSETLVRGCAPDTWFAMMPNEQVRLVELQMNSREFIVVKMGLSIAGGPTSILKIERVQNPTLHIQYTAKAMAMERHGSNERTLYHGTSPETVRSINIHGFNRSACGQNGTSNGHGVYFATKAKYSCRERFCCKDKRGHKFLYQCKVLVGRYTKGAKDMKHPPLIDPGPESCVRYDCTVDDVTNPQIFTIFHDNQAYPEYLITFV